jgi:FkbM family methyltransferase
MIFRGIHVFTGKKKRTISRNNINFEVDITEGIDLSIFLFGNFQNHIVDNPYVSISDDAVIFDVGANIGTMTLTFAKKAVKGKVYAFEPTNYAYQKLVKNISLNPGLSKRITTIQTFLGNETAKNHGMKAYASWKVDKKRSGVHPLHGGSVQQTSEVGSVSMDDFCSENNIEKLDLIKIDTDGYEFEILKGAEKTITKHSPVIILEIGLYLLEEHNVKTEQFFDFLNSKGYKIISSKKGKIISKDNYMSHIPMNSTIDVIAVPSKK